MTNIDKQPLVELIAAGKSEWEISRILHTAPQTIRIHIRKFHLCHPSSRLRDLSDLEWQDLIQLDQLCPGLVEAAYRMNEDPALFFHQLYEAYIYLQKITRTIKKLGGRYTHYVQHQKLERDYVAWSDNYAELVLSERLRTDHIIHIRQFAWATKAHKNYIADFYIPSSHLLLEVNGSIHGRDWAKARDVQKRILAKELGYKRLEIQSSKVLHNLDSVMQSIKKIL
jgi:very-short-patch-repair endonuclease